MKKKGIFNWPGMFMIFAAYAIIFIVFLIIFGVTDVGDSVITIKGNATDMQHTHNQVLMSYLNSDVTIEFGRLQMIELIDLSQQDPGTWKRMLEVKSRVFLRDSGYYIGLYDKDPLENVLNLQQGFIKSHDALDAYYEQGAPFKVTESIPMVLSQGKIIWVALIMGEDETWF